MEHRSYQKDALGKSKEAYDRGVWRQLIQLFTGGGKTVVFASIPAHYSFKKRTLFVIHTDELANQTIEKLHIWNPGARVGLEMGDSYADSRDTFVVASVATIGRATASSIARLQSFDPAEFDAIVIDEAHHAPADSYQRVINHFGLAHGQDNQGRLLLGVTATTKRGDGKGLDTTFDEIVFEFSMRRAIKEGWQVDFKGFRVRTETTLDGVKDLTSDKQLSLAVNTPKRNAEIVEKWLEVGENRKTIGFTVDIEHAKCLAQAFVDKGIAAEAIWGRDPDRKAKIERHVDGTTLVLLNCGVLIEGYDDPGVACIILGRPSGSSTVIEQMVGRGGRLPTGINNLFEARAAGIHLTKEDCILIDVADNTLRHKLSSLASLVGLPPKLDLKGMGLLEAMEKFDAASTDHPDVDLESLEDLDNIQSYIESVDLFDFTFAPEVMENSEMQWHKTPNGNYLLLLPNNERITITQDILGVWKISGTVRGSSFDDQERSLPRAFQTADSMLTILGRVILPHAKRSSSAKWAGEAATAAQIAAITAKLTRMKKAVPDFSRVTKHEAKKMLSLLYMAA